MRRLFSEIFGSGRNEVRNPGGYIIIDGQMGRKEADTFTCGHCNKIVIVPARASPTELGGLCGCCDSLLCPDCVRDGRCLPLEVQLARLEALRSYDA